MIHSQQNPYVTSQCNITSMRFGWHLHSSTVGLIFAYVGLVIILFGVSIHFRYSWEVHCCPSSFLCNLPEERCAIAESWYMIGWVLIDLGLALIVSGAIIDHVEEERITYTCPCCGMTRRISVTSIPEKCPNCGLSIERFEEYQSQK